VLEVAELRTQIKGNNPTLLVLMENIHASGFYQKRQGRKLKIDKVEKFRSG
jgi:hypothetical protein